MAKQVLALNGKDSMIQQTVARLAPVAPLENFWVVTNELLQGVIRKQLRKLKKEQVIAEPETRNTAPAIGLAAFLLLKTDPDAVVGMILSDVVIADVNRFS